MPKYRWWVKSNSEGAREDYKFGENIYNVCRFMTVNIRTFLKCSIISIIMEMMEHS